MVQVPAAQLKTGEKLVENVLTKRNHVLFNKGRIITERDIEILKAFLIPVVEIEGDETATEYPIVDNDWTNNVIPFHDKYESMIKLMKRVFTIASAGGNNPPILDIRTSLESLLAEIDRYHILSFTPRQFQLRDFIFHKSIMVSLTSYILAKWLQLPAKDQMPVALAGLLHDIGNAKVDEGILFKASRLKPEEIEEMKKHTVYGYTVLKNVPAINEGVKLAAVQHHEREDGSGYPLGVKGDKIHVYSKIVAIADMFHAITSDRFHKKRSSPYLALEQLQAEAFGKLDPSMVQTFIAKVTQFHNGTKVKLSDNRVGEIVFSDRNHPTRPWVNVNGHIVNLVTERHLYIQAVIDL